MLSTQWRKLGRLYEPSARHRKLLSHAANPLAVQIDGDTFRVFYSGRDLQNRSSVGYFDFDLGRRRTIGFGEAPVFAHGAPDSFYSHGVSIGNCYEAGGRRFILFMGWHVPDDAHWYGEIGRLVLGDDLSLRLDPEHPFLPLSSTNPVSLSYPWVISDPAGIYHMWYGSTETWDAGNGEMVHPIRHATSPDAELWVTDEYSIPVTIGVAQAFSRPTVVHDPAGGWRMWFSYRSGSGTSYRIGEAWSADARSWAMLLDRPGIDVSSDGWDSEMIEYPFVFEHEGLHYMLYNGNGFGKSGIGLAVAERLGH